MIASPDEFAKTRASHIEVRLDLARNPVDVTKLARPGTWVLATARRTRDGGKWKGSESDRRQALISCARFADAVDIEIDCLKKFPAFSCEVIASVHDMKKVPSNAALDRMLGLALKANRFKVAGFARTAKEAERLAEWAIANHTPALPVTAIAMGEAGRWTRWILPRILGGPAYAPIGRPVAPGQINAETLERLIKLSNSRPDVAGRRGKNIL